MEVENNIPISRGLGSSASLIVAGVLAACHILNIKDEQFVVDTIIELEGHPDNVVPAFLGGFVTSYKTELGYKYIKYPVSNALKFMIGFPNVMVSTEKAREVLPKFLTYSDAVFNLSRVINLPNALSIGDIDFLKEILDDKIHEQYRIPLIEEADKILSISKDKG